jgi:hypothetical protein
MVKVKEYTHWGLLLNDVYFLHARQKLEGKWEIEWDHWRLQTIIKSCFTKPLVI